MNLADLYLDHLSPSSISTYLDSPLRWYQHYVEGHRDNCNESLHRGIVCHSALEHRLTHYECECSWEAITQESDIDTQTDGRLHDFCGDVAAAPAPYVLEQYWEKYGQHIKPLNVEWPFAVPIPYAKQLRKLIGRVDVVHDIDGTPALIDFKTGGRKRSFRDVENDIQPIIYGLALRDLVGVKGTISFAYHQLVFKTIPEIVILQRPVSEAEMEQFETRFLPGFVRTLEHQIETDSFYYNPNARYGTGLAA